jgi:hypothetical protein
LKRPFSASKSWGACTPLDVQPTELEGGRRDLPVRERTPSRHNRRIYAASPWSREFSRNLTRSPCSATPSIRFLSPSTCSGQALARSFAPRFLPTLGRPDAVALRFIRCDQLTGGLAPPRVRPCRAHQ